MSERTTLIPPPCPLLLAVGCRGALLARLRDASAELDVALEVVELVEVATSAALLRPLALLISSDVYAFDPDEFDALARSVGARRILVEDSEPCHKLEARLAAALGQAAEQSDELPALASTQRAHSGVRWVAARGAGMARASNG
jgi:hypothetical protein